MLNTGRAMGSQVGATTIPSGHRAASVFAHKFRRAVKGAGAAILLLASSAPAQNLADQKAARAEQMIRPQAATIAFTTAKEFDDATQWRIWISAGDGLPLGRYGGDAPGSWALYIWVETDGDTLTGRDTDYRKGLDYSIDPSAQIRHHISNDSSYAVGYAVIEFITEAVVEVVASSMDIPGKSKLYLVDLFQRTGEGAFMSSRATGSARAPGKTATRSWDKK